MSIAAHAQSPALLPTVWKLLVLRWRITVNSFRHAKRHVKFFTVLGYVALAALAAFLFWLSWLALNFVSSPRLEIYTGIHSGPLMDALPAAIFTVMFFGILLTSFGVLLQALYLSGDMDFLLAAPVPIRAVFVTKLLQAVLPNFSLMAFFGLPLLYGMGAARGYNLLFYPLVPLIMAALTLAAAGFSSLLVMLIVRVFPARRVAEVLGFVGATASILCSQSFNLMSMSRRDISFTNGQQLYAIVPFVERFNDPWFPINWAGRGLVELGSGNWLVGILLVGLTLALFSGGFWIALVTSERWYYTGWAGMQVVARKKRSTTMSASTLPRETLASRLRQLVPAPVRSVVQKDFLVLRRDLRNFSQLVTPLIFGVIYAISFLRGGALPADASPYLKALASYGTVLIALMVGSSLVTRLGSMGFSQEGKNYWMLKVSPVRPMHLLIAKFIVAYLPPVVIGSLIVLVLSTFRPTSILSVVYGVLIVAFSMMPMTSILVAFGVAGANFNWDDPRKMTSGRFGCMGMIVMSVYSLVTLGLFVVPPMLALFLRQPEIYGDAVGLVLGGVFSVGGALSALWLARSRVERLGEE